MSENRKDLKTAEDDLL